MKYSITAKFIAIFLAACALVTAVASAFGIAMLGGYGLYNEDEYNQWREMEMSHAAGAAAYYAAQRVAVTTLSNCPEELWGLYVPGFRTDLEDYAGLNPDSYYYAVRNINGHLLETGGIENLTGSDFQFQIVSGYPMLTDSAHADEVWNWQGQPLYIHYIDSPEYTITVTLAEDSIAGYKDTPVGCIDFLFQVRHKMILSLALGLLVFAICAVYLCCAAGKNSKNDTVRPSGLNRMSLDLYLVLAAFLCCGGVYLTIRILDAWVLGESLNLGAVALAAILLILVAVVFVGFCFAAAAQLKMPGFFWWHNSVIGWILDKIFAGIRFVARSIRQLFSLLPTVWRYLLIAAMMGLIPLGLFLLGMNEPFFAVLFVLALIGDIVIVCYGAYAYGTLLRGAQQMRRGSLNTKISTRYLRGAYKTCAEDLNALADVATQAAANQMRSERMKTELITNVSHDIKTPLTSIINYVDLLQKPHSPEEEKQYLEVLGRQSQRLKKLIVDLMDMSKATTGNMTVEITTVDAAEALTQALGEFSDKLAAAQLTPVFHQPEAPVPVLADGRLTWRVLSNLLSNIVKYALPGTRVYIDLQQQADQVLVSLKNISRESLNVTADELTERFVRGDASRNTEGSGLGLNIAKSLMELQKGQLQLLVDGDLFKVTLIFPAATKKLS